MQRYTLIHVMLTILQCTLLAVLANLHDAISYSRRSGTPAYDFPEQVHEREKQERSRVMNAIAEEVRREVLAAYVGTEDDVLLETPLSGTLFTGYTRLYIPVVVSAPGHESGQIVHVRLGEYDGERVRAALC